MQYFGWITARARSRRARQDGYRSTFEVLEARQVLSAASFAGTFASEFAGPIVAPQAEVPAAISVYRNGVLIESISPAEDTDVERGLALRAALANAQDFDTLMLGAFTYDMGSAAHVEFPDRVTVIGVGQELTRITSSCPQNNDGAATFTLNHLTELRDLWLEGSLLDGSYQPLVGMQGTPVENVEIMLRRVKITGDSDGLFIWTNNQFTYTIIGYDLEISTRYDALALLGSGLNPQTIKLYNSTLTVSQPSTIPAHISNAVNLRSGFLGLYNCTINVTGDENSVQTVGVWAVGFGTAEVVNCTFNVSAPSGIAYDLFIQNGGAVTVMGGSGSAEGGGYTSNLGLETYEPVPDSSLAGSYLFYNNSRWDGFTPGASLADLQVIAPDKVAWRPGEGQAGFQNISSYARGINGVMIDLAGPHGALQLDDFAFRVGTTTDIATWGEAPAPTMIKVWGGEGVNNSDRVELIWPNNAIENQWLEITMLANERTGLAVPEVFYFGSRVGDTGLGTTPVAAVTNGTDQVAMRNNLGAGQTLESVFDVNRDGITNAADETVVRNNYGFLALLTDFSEAPPAEASSAEAFAQLDLDPADLTTVAVGVARQQASALQLEVEGDLPRFEDNRLPASDLNPRMVREVLEAMLDEPVWRRSRR